jgi:hypothetical protein
MPKLNKNEILLLRYFKLNFPKAFFLPITFYFCRGLECEIQDYHGSEYCNYTLLAWCSLVNRKLNIG